MNWQARQCVNCTSPKETLGKKQLELHFSRKYYNPYLGEIISYIVRNCKVCAQVKPVIMKYGTLGALGPAKFPLDIVPIDTKSGFKAYGTKKKHLHLAIDVFTRFVWVVASTTKVGMDFIHLIQKVMTLQKPRIIVADNYPAIAGKIFQGYLKKIGITMLFTAVNHPASNGIVERVNQTLVQAFKSGSRRGGGVRDRGRGGRSSRGGGVRGGGGGRSSWDS